MRLKRFAMLIALALAFSATAALADQVDNPRYDAWTKYNVGSSETLQGDVNYNGMTMTFVATYTLSEKADDHVTVDLTTSMQMFGQQHQQSQTQTIPAKTDAANVQQLPDEKVDAAGKTYDCKVYQLPDNGKQGATAKAWVNDGIPGGCVKLQAASSTGNTTVTYLLQSYVIK
jgi:hypothetical protein